jgi:iron complex transport system substrate-binding protein
MKSSKKSFALVSIVLVIILALTGCAQEEQTQTPVNEGADTSFAGRYSASAEGYAGVVPVTVDLKDDGSILNITVGDNQETDGIGNIAEEKITKAIVDSQSLNVDAVSGATVTGDAIIEAVANALVSAGVSTDRFNYVPIVKLEETIAEINPEAMPEKKEIIETITLTDAKGREVEIGLPISSYAISTMDVIDYIVPLKGEEAFHMLVGSGQDGGHGLNKYAKLYTPIVGNYMEHTGQISDHNAPFDLEMVLAMEPDVLIVNSAMAAHRYALEIEDQLTQAGIKIVLIDVPGKSLKNSVQQTMGILGQLFQEEEKAAEVSEFISQQYELIASKISKENLVAPTVYYEKSGYADIFGSTATSKSGWGLVVDIAGGKNIADDLLLDTAASGGGGNTLDPEYVLNADPDFIVVSGINDGWLDIVNEKKDCKFDIANRNGWSNLKAVKNNVLYEFAHSTSRSIYAFYPSLKMATIFYPEEFEGVNSEAVLDEFFDRFMLVDKSISTWFNSVEMCKGTN